MSNHKRYRRLTFEQRVKLVVNINSKNGSAASATKELKVSRQTIYDEIKNHFYYQSIPTGTRSPCKLSSYCSLNKNRVLSCNNMDCEKYSPVLCHKLEKYPFVCNKCSNNNNCKLQKRFYDPGESHDEALLLRVDSRSKDFESDPKVDLVDKLISPIIKNGNSINHAVNAIDEKLPVSQRTIRRWIYKRGLSCFQHDLPMWARYQKSSSPRPSRTHAKNFEVIAHRMYPEFIRFLNANPGVMHVQTDSVVGKKSIKLLLLLFILLK